MWNNYWGARPRRDIPRRNYNESSSESDEENFQSPSRPPVSREGSPQPLAVPTLSDNVDEELAHVNQTLRNIGHTPLFRKKTPEDDPEGVQEEVVEEGVVVGVAPGSPVKADNMPDEREVVDFEDENGQYNIRDILFQSQNSVLFSLV